MILLELENVSVKLGGRSLLRDVSLQLRAGELLGLIGPNGAGKSTLLKTVVQLLPTAGGAWTGRIRLLGQDTQTLDPRERARRLAYLSQDDRVQWPIRVEDLVALGRHPYHPTWRGVAPWASGRPTADDQRAIHQALRTTDIWHLRTRRATELSGGERARARLARALAVEAPLLLADEPVAALDPLHQLKVMSYLRDYCQAGATASKRLGAQNEVGHSTTNGSQNSAHHSSGDAEQTDTRLPGRAAIVVMHDLTLASRFCDRLLLLHQGEPVALGPPGQVLSPERLRDIYGIRAVSAKIEGQSYVLPWALSDAEANRANPSVRQAP
ncbi:ABC transporter ATP-binding protein [Thiorhodovibrio frisius]|uniref:ABC-type cobalamin/Fe3+-siderophore transport system, ATPase component n=1 Tax=Thiorhodovibrio frisius TaxID=631362 RepID=H8Z7S1_9GAMM|nr:ABC transporter ATP-binding protein [Thiorhodovibrio frisius]EIC19924.1 ABC-type cobalamin/Fe3+-siderophore transport system, ATPase component [Thiorhodovibrio frisius]WPL20653.1 Hemin import ATP-binding protein HmuV [Thiorhodovibrio frisius]